MSPLSLANTLTLMRILLGFLAVACLYGHNWLFSLGALIAFLVGVLTDLLDGIAARSRGEVSPLGMFLDPLVDKVFVLSLLITLVEFQLFPAWIVVLILFRELAVTALREYAVGRGVDIPAIWSGKLKSTLQFLAIFLALLAITCVRYSSDVLGIGILDGAQNSTAARVGITGFILSQWVLLASVVVGYYGMAQLVRHSWSSMRKQDLRTGTGAL